MLVCQDCYQYQADQGTQHKQLADWYHAKKDTPKAFEFISGFAQEKNGDLKYNSWTFNNHPKYGTGQREMEDFEKKILQHVVKYKIKNYQVGKTPCNSKHIQVLLQDLQTKRF